MTEEAPATNQETAGLASTVTEYDNIISGHKDYLIGVDEGGVGCVAVHPSRTIFAVGGKGFQPKIYIYSYPEKKILKILAGGAERGYSCLNFSNTGDKLASVSMSPDYMLTIWDWETELMGLHSKAFGQDIYKVQFSEDDTRRLTTSGTGHIRFWKMAATFTGLKLQGYIGKFGKIDLTDVETFIELPDGKVLSGTETGALLLWEGNFIKCRFVQVGGAQCHVGLVTYVDLDREEKCVITAGIDGYIRWWDFPSMDAAEVDSDVTLDFELNPICEYYIGPDVGVRMMLDSKKLTAGSSTRFFVVLDTRGQMQTVNFTLVNTNDHQSRLTLRDTVSSLRANQQKQLQSQEDTEFVVDDHDKFIAERLTFDKFHAGAITGVDTCPIDHLAVTSGVDGSVRIVNYNTRKEIAHRQFNTAITSVKWIPTAIDPTGTSVIVGFADGVVRVLTLGEGKEGGPASLIRTVVFKPHNAPVIELSFDEQSKLLATSGKDGIVFFLRCESLTTWSPIRFWTVSIPSTAGGRPPVLCERISWNAESNRVLCSCTDSILREVDVSQLEEFITAAATEEVVTFEAAFPMREVTVKVPVLTTAKSSLVALPSAASIKVDSTQGEDSVSNVDPTSRPESPTKMSTKGDDALSNLAVAKVSQGIYSLGRSPGGLLTSANVGQKAYFYECEEGEEVPKTELLTGLYSTPNNKDFAKNPSVTAMRYSWSRNFLLVGTADGSVTVRAAAYLETFTRSVGNNSSTEGVAFIANSFDDRFVLAVGKDGVLSVSRVRLDLMRQRSISLFKDLDARVFGDDLIKPTPKAAPAEPTYLTAVSTLTVLRELSLFEPSPDAIEANVLMKGLASVEQERTDISGDAYSIQDNRLKLEEDNKKSGAEDLKTKIRGMVKLLQKDYEKIVRENESIPEAARLNPEEMTVDREYFDILASQGKAMIEEVHKECAHDCERSEKLYSKIRSRLMAGLIVEEFSLTAFTPPTGTRSVQSVVKSLRCQALDSSVVEILKEVHSMVRQAELKEAQARTNEASQKKIMEAVDEMKQRMTNKEDDNAAIVSNIKAEIKTVSTVEGTGEKEEHLNESSAAARRIKRKARKEEMSSHQAKKPNEDEDDIRDLNAIKLAEKTIGDYKLKCADDYEVPEDQRINALKKIRQMAMLEESMLTMRLQYNERFLALRSVKRAIVFAIRRDNKRIREIDAQLRQSHLSENLWEPEFRAEEFPDDADEVTLSELKHYQNLRKNLNWAKAAPPKQSITTGNKTEIFKNVRTGSYEYMVRKRDIDEETRLYGFLCDEAVANITPNSEEGPKYYEVKDSIVEPYFWRPTHQEGFAIKRLESDIPVLRNIKLAAQKRMQIPEVTKIQTVLNHEMTTRLNFERTMILKKMQENINDFREAIDQLRLDRHSITADLKLAELKLLTLFQEYKLLQTFESRDSTLQQKQIKCKTEETEIVTSIGENKSRLESKQEEIQQWNEKLQGILSEFKTMLPDTHPYVETLTKIFKKKVKRNKGGEDGGEEDEDYESDHDDDEDEDDDDEVEDICPPGCDQALFERILDLREKKLDTEEVSAEIQKNIDDLKKTIDRLKQREKQIIKDALQTELEVQQFQLQKQSALNQIFVVVPLQIAQLYMFENSGILTGPTDKLAPAATTALTNNAATNAILAGIEGLLEEAPVNPEVEALKSQHKRTLVSTVDLKSHVVFTQQNLIRIQERISELHTEIDQAKESFRELHKERSVFIKDREAQRLEIEAWSSRCTELQMLKFGRIIDLDELESKSDRSKELEAENALKEDEASFKVKAAKYLKECALMQERLSEVTVRNTELLNEVAELTETQLQISRELNAPGQVVSHASKLDNFKEMEETKRIVAYVQFQAKELESLRTELNMLKRKEAPPVLSQSMNLPSPPPMRQKEEVILPPITNNKKTPGNTTGVTMG